MTINIDTDFNRIDYNLYEKDYCEKFFQEMAFGKKLNIFISFFEHLLDKDNKNLMKDWIESGWGGYSSSEAKRVLTKYCNELLSLVE